MDRYEKTFLFLAIPIEAVLLLFLFFVKKPSEKDKLIVYIAARNSVCAIVLIGVYFLLVSACASALGETRKFSGYVYMILIALSSLRAIPFVYKIFIRDIPCLEGYSKRKNCWFWVSLFDLFIMLLVASSMFNYATLMLFPNSFSYTFSLFDNWYRTGFECIHYTFTLITTTGNSTISAVHPATKVLEMVEMLVFYFVYGCWLTNLMCND